MRKDRFTDEALRNARALAELKYSEREEDQLRFSEAYDFARCQRPDGSFYPIASGKQCRKGRESSLFDDDGPGRTGKSYGRIAGGSFVRGENKKAVLKRDKPAPKADQPIRPILKTKQKFLPEELDERMAAFRKGGLLKRRQKALKLAETVEKMIKREQELAREGMIDNVFKGKYSAIEKMLRKINNRYGINTTSLLQQLDSLPK